VKLLTTDEAAAWLRLHRNTVLRRARELGGVKVGKMWRFREADLESLFGASPQEAACLSTNDPKDLRTGGESSSYQDDREYKKVLARKIATGRKSGTTSGRPRSGANPSSANVLFIRGSRP
jgi:excisionase family DNA binding protein